MSRVLGVLALLAGSALSVQADGPVDKVVTMLKKLKTDLDNDEKSEQAVYDKYACWCEETTQRKATAIEDAKSMLKRTGQDILKLKGKVSTRTDEIEEKQQQIKDNEEAQEMATTARSKENGKCQEDSATTNEAMTAINAAMDVLQKATSFLQADATAKLQKAMTGVLDAAPAAALAALSTDKIAQLRSFSQVKVGYAPQSATIQGILGDMYTTMGVDLMDSTAAEAKANRIFEGFIAEKDKELRELKEILVKKTKEKAEAEAMLAESTEAFDDVSKQLKADVEFFDTTKDACEKTTDSWKVRHDLRVTEIEGIAEALKILTGPEAKKLFAKAIKPGKETMFLQLDSTPKKNQQVDMEKVYGELKKRASGSHSLRLAAIAAQVRLAKAGHFDKVIKSIDDLIGVLAKEQESDTKLRNKCDEQYQDIAQESNKLDWKIKNNKAKIQKLENLIKDRGDDKDQTVKEIGETEKDIKDMTAERKKENGEFVQAKKDDLASIVLLEKAKEVMSDFYKKNSIKVEELLQVDGPLDDEDKAPDATFSDKGKRKNQSKGIVSLLTMIIEDLNDEVTNETENEKEAQLSYEKSLATAEQLLSDLKAKKVSLEEAIAKRKKEKTDENKDKKANEDDLATQVKTKDGLKEDCDYMLAKHDERRDYRTAETEALRDAKEFLVNYVEPPAEESLVQSSPSQASFSRISFAHLH
jgi:DNA repair exonuclease SbcCD ATPase subunit